mgnify:CR=1 FL=1
MKTTNAQFAMFKQHCLKWQRELSLMDWKIYFQHKKLGDRYANTAWNIQGKNATISLALEVPADHQLHIEDSALHEMLHILLASVVRDSMAHDSLVERAEHEIIHRLIPLLIKP